MDSVSCLVLCDLRSSDDGHENRFQYCILLTPLFVDVRSAFQLWEHVGLKLDHARWPWPWYALQRLWHRHFNSRARVVVHGVFKLLLVISHHPQRPFDVPLDVEHPTGVDGWIG